MKYTVQNIIFPDPTVCCETKMYYIAHGSFIQNKQELHLNYATQCAFSTYFNSFSANKWRKYIKIDNLQLELIYQGKLKIEIFSAYWYLGKAIIECQNSHIVESSSKDVLHMPIDFDKYDNIFFKITAISNNVVFYGGCYFTEISPDQLNKVDIDLVMCTFKRETYVRRNINLIVDNYIRQEKYNGARHFRLLIVDNGRTLPAEEIEIPGVVSVYPNLNVGGSGGFCRGMIESLHLGISTHILFMDDDVLVQTEAFEKCYNLLSLLKPDYQKDFIGGAMFRLDQKNIQHENLAAFKGNHLISLKGMLDVSQYENVLFNDKAELVSGIYCAWWFCCMPKTVVNLENLPYPFFIRMDDIEYSIRNLHHAISLNGISVWHEAFDKKYSTLMENYFMFRNNLVVNMLHQTGTKKMALQFLFHRFMHDIFRYDYGGAELLLDGVDSFLKGPEFFKQVDTIKDLKQHGVKQAKMLPIRDVPNADMLYGGYKNDLSKGQENLLVKCLRFISCNGHLLPSFLFRDKGFAEYGYGNNSKMYFLKKMVIACDPNFEKATVLSIDRKRAFCLFVRWLKLCRQINKQYKKLEKEYRESFHEMTSEPFWRNYLKL